MFGPLAMCGNLNHLTLFETIRFELLKRGKFGELVLFSWIVSEIRFSLVIFRVGR